MLYQDWFVISITGPDTIKYLQGQIPVNLLKLNNLTSTCSFLSVHTGKVIGLYRLVRVSDQKVVLLVKGEQNKTKILTHLKKFAVFSKVTITESPAYLCATTNPELIISTREKIASLEQYDDQSIKTVDLSTQVTLILLEGNEVYQVCAAGSNLYFSEASLEKLSFTDQDELTLSEEQFLGLSLLYGVNYEFSEEQVDKFLPQALGIDNKLEASVSYTKGCYQGQEGIARAKFRGQNPHVFSKFICEDKQLIAYLKSADQVNLKLEVILEQGSVKESGTIFNFYTYDNSEGYLDLYPQEDLVILGAVLSKKLDANEYNYQISLDNGEKYPLVVVK